MLHPIVIKRTARFGIVNKLYRVSRLAVSVLIIFLEKYFVTEIYDRWSSHGTTKMCRGWSLEDSGSWPPALRSIIEPLLINCFPEN